MDIRDFKNMEVPPVTHDYGRLGFIFQLQADLMLQYVNIEKLPHPPFDLDVKSNQIILKDFIARIIEEIGEGYESLDRLNPIEIGLAGPILNLIQNFNEEMADAIHFLIETLIASDVGLEDIKKFAYSRLTDPQKVFVEVHNKSNEILYILYLVANRLNYDAGLRPVGKRITHPETENLFMRGGLRVSGEFLEEFSILAWHVTYPLMLARNSLKNKPWKQTEMTTDHSVYRGELMKALLALVRLCEYSEIFEDSFYHIYYKKNRVNLFRIKSKY